MNVRTHALSALVLAGLAACATPRSDVDLTPARMLLEQDESARAADELEAILAVDPANADAWHLLGVARSKQGDDAGAAEAYVRRLELGPNAIALYNLACARARLGEADRAFEALFAALELGTALDDLVPMDPDLESLHSDARFQAVLEHIETRQAPCRARPEYRQLDFMLGDWVVRSREGQAVGTSRFEVVSQGCALLETYTQGASYSGQGLHYFDPGSGEWRQTWTDSGGGIGVLSGGFRDGAMHYEGTVHDAQGDERHVRGSFVRRGPEGVKQIGEATDDGGRTWQAQFEFFYERREAAALDPGQAIAHVLDIDRVIAKQRDLGTEDVPLATSIASYVRGLDAIDFGACPPEFTQAFRRHRDAWEASIPYFVRHADLRGEMHVLFDRLRAEEPGALEAQKRAIMDTWAAVDAIAQQYARP